MAITRVFLPVLVACALGLAFDGDNFTQKFDALPQAVKDTAKAHMENAIPVSISSAQNGQGWKYQVNTRLNGKYHDLVIDDKGKLVKDETDLASVPAAAREAIQKKANTSKIMTLEKVTEGEQVSYGAVIKDDASGTFAQLSVTADGTVRAKN